MWFDYISFYDIDVYKRQKSLEEKLFDPEISADSGKVKELYEEKVSLEEKLEELYEKWEEIQ